MSEYVHQPTPEPRLWDWITYRLLIWACTFTRSREARAFARHMRWRERHERFHRPLRILACKHWDQIGNVANPSCRKNG